MGLALGVFVIAIVILLVVAKLGDVALAKAGSRLSGPHHYRRRLVRGIPCGMQDAVARPYEPRPPVTLRTVAAVRAQDRRGKAVPGSVPLAASLSSSGASVVQCHRLRPQPRVARRAAASKVAAGAREAERGSRWSFCPQYIGP